MNAKNKDASLELEEGEGYACCERGWFEIFGLGGEGCGEASCGGCGVGLGLGWGWGYGVCVLGMLSGGWSLVVSWLLWARGLRL